jgi:hypothetical protein
MAPPKRKQGDTHRWLEKARWRMAECERELRQLDEATDGARRQKIIRRMHSYRRIVQDYQERVRRDPMQDLEELESEVVSLRRRIREAAAALVVARDNWKELQARWGKLADEVMKERERRGEPAGKVPRMDFDFRAPPPDAPPEERAAHKLIRSLKL